MRVSIGFTLILLGFAPLLGAQEAGSRPDSNEFVATWQAFLEARQSGDDKAQLQLAKQVLEIGRTVLDENDDRIPALMANYGLVLAEQRQLKPARELLVEALDRAEALHGKDSGRLLPYLDKLADVYGGLNEDSVFRTTLRRGVRLSADSNGADSIEHADVLQAAGARLVRYGRARSGRNYLEDAAGIYARYPGAADAGMAQAAFWLGKAEISLRDNASATDYLLDAVERMTALEEPLTELELTAHAHLVHLYEARGMSDSATEHCLAIGARRADRQDAELQPVFRMAPRYPMSALSSGDEGFVAFRFTVDELGFVRDPVVIDKKGGADLQQAALEAVERFRYAPKFVDGEPVAVADQTTRITFKID